MLEWASRRPQVELALQGIFAARKNDEIFRPAGLCNQWLQFWKEFYHITLYYCFRLIFQ
jgi:hypothetical protein